MIYETTPKKRKTRHDKGTMKANDRDILALTRIADQYAMRFDHVQELLSNYPGPAAGEDGISESAARQVVARWRRVGWVHYQQLLANEPAWVWLTRQGLQALGLTQYTATPPALARIRHLHAINAVRLAVENEGDDWTSERQIRTGKQLYKKGETGHTPDAILQTVEDNETIAIEVEITQKKPADLLKIVDMMLNDWNEEVHHYRYDEVWYYVTSEAIKRALISARAAQSHRKEFVKIHLFDPVTWSIEDEEEER